MKRETMEAKLAALLGLAEVKQEIDAKKNARVEGISEETIQSFREIQGVTYFLVAPKLFSQRVCKNCGTHYLVSRLHVAYCSYECIRESLREMGLEWHRGQTIETIVNSAYDGNEPIWIRNLETLKTALELLTSAMPSAQEKNSISQP